jgi:hypothetical protein
MTRISLKDARKHGITGKKKAARIDRHAREKPYPTFERLCAIHGLPAPQREYPERKSV